MHGVREEKDSFYLMGSGKKIITEMQETLREKKETEEIQKTSSENEETLDIIIKKLLTQNDANLAEGYWLFGYDDKHRPTGKTCMEIYVDDLDEISYIAVITFGSEIFSDVEEETYKFCTAIYAVFEENIENLFSLRHSYSNSLEEAREVLEMEEKIAQRKYIYVDTVESYEWPDPKYQGYTLEDMETLEIYRSFDVLIKENGGFYFLPETEVYLGLWNGYSQEIRLMYKMKSNKGNTNYYMTEIGLDGSVRGYINEATKDVYERFKQISIKMS